MSGSPPSVLFGLGAGRRPGAHAPAGGTAAMRGLVDASDAELDAFADKFKRELKTGAADRPPLARTKKKNTQDEVHRNSRTAEDARDPRDEAIRQAHEQNAVLARDLRTARALVAASDERENDIESVRSANARLEAERDAARADAASQAAFAAQAQRWIDETQAAVLRLESEARKPHVITDMEQEQAPALPRPRSARAPSGYDVGAPAGLGRRPPGIGTVPMNITLTRDQRSRLQRIARAQGDAQSKVVGRYIEDDPRGDGIGDDVRLPSPPPVPAAPTGPAQVPAEVVMLFDAFRDLLAATTKQRTPT